MKATIKITAILVLFSLSSMSASAQYSKRNVRNFINRTSYIIGEAYDMVYFYGYYSQGNLSKAINHQNYAKFLYNMGSYRNAIYHSDLGRRYALRVIYSSNNYWDNYYRPHYYPSYRPPQANRPPQGNNNNRPPQSNTQYGHRGSSTNVTSTTKSNSNNNNNVTRTSKYASSGDDLETRNFETWEQNYYSKEELSIIGNSSRPSEKELETAVNNNSSIRRVSNDEEVMKNGISDFSNDINTFKKSHQEEAKTMAISRPSDFGTTTEVTRSTANKMPTSTSTNTSPTRQTQTATPTQTTTPTRNPSTQTAKPTQTQTTTPTRNPSTSTQTTVPSQNQATPTRNTQTQTKTTTPTRNSTATQNKATQPASTNKTTETRSTQTTNQNKSTNTTQTRSSSTSQDTQKESTTTQKSNTNTRSR